MARVTAGSRHVPVHLLAIIVVLLCSTNVRAARDSGHHRKIVIHVPYIVKNHHHMHTVFKYIKAHEPGDHDDRDDPEELQDHDDQQQPQQENDDYGPQQDGYIGELHNGDYGPQQRPGDDGYDQGQAGGHGDHGHALYHTTFLVRHNEGHLLQDEESHESHEVIEHGKRQSRPSPGHAPLDDYHPHHEDNRLGQQENVEDGHGYGDYGYAHYDRQPDRRRRKRGHRRTRVRPNQIHLDEGLTPPKYDIMEPQREATSLRERMVAVMKPPPARMKHAMYSSSGWRPRL